ncbi:hypothetical protein QWI28_28050 [Citrobacter freundii]|nr:hypothetical protein [Citrobacter freundii]
MKKDGELVARVTGIYDIAYLKDKTGDLGVAGPAVGVVEKNLIDELQESVAKLDFDGMKKKAIDNYWPRQVSRIPGSDKASYQNHRSDGHYPSKHYFT